MGQYNLFHHIDNIAIYIKMKEINLSREADWHYQTKTLLSKRMKKDWENNLHQLCESIDISMIDFSDERTQYIMSK